jgi:hypothetical protein
MRAPLTLSTLRKILNGPAPLQALRVIAATKPRAAQGQPQLTLWVVDGDDIPERPWLICGCTPIDCRTLGCKGLQARVCVARQAATDANRNQDRSKGQGSPYPLCDTLRCIQGRAIRDAIDPTRVVTWRGAGPGGRFERQRSDLGQQHVARVRLMVTGMLDEVPSVDNGPRPVELDGDGENSAETASQGARQAVPEGADREPQGPAGVGARDARSVRAQVTGGAQDGRFAHGGRGGREGATRRSVGDPRPCGGEAVCNRAGARGSDGGERIAARRGA